VRTALILACLVAAVAAPSAAALEPNDEGWYLQWAERTMRLPLVWNHTTGSSDVVIAAVDTGVEADRIGHLADFEGALAPGWDFTDGDALIDDEHGHGTLAAGIMVARGNNRLGIAGHCWKCRLMPVRVSRNGFATDEIVALGIRYAVDNGARIVSVGMVREDGSVPEPVLASAIEYAVAKGAFVVTPSGNQGNEVPTYPGAFPGVIATAGTDEQDKLFPWSTRGPWVPLAAPGCHALIALDGSWGWHCGTSFTGPAIAGIAALALSLKPDLTAEQIAAGMRATAVPIDGIGGGRVDAYAALQRMGAIPPPPPPAPKATTSTRTRTGKIRRGTRIALAVGAGRLRVSFSVKPAETCSLSVSAGGELLVGDRRGRGAVGLDERVEAGSYTARITCRTSKLKRYKLTVTSVRPVVRPAQLSGR
jgi:thermitase